MAEGHRERLRKRFMSESIDTIPEYIVLEMMLQGIIVRRDTCEIARQLLKKFGNLGAVIDAPLNEITNVPGVGEVAAQYIKLLPMFYRKYAMSKQNMGILMNDPKTVGEYFINRCIGYTREVVLLACLDAKRRLIGCEVISDGTINMSEVYIRKILETAIKFNASRVILAHTHPGGLPIPSMSDVEITREIEEVLTKTDIVLEDHVIVAGDQYMSVLRGRRQI